MTSKCRKSPHEPRMHPCMYVYAARDATSYWTEFSKTKAQSYDDPCMHMASHHSRCLEMTDNSAGVPTGDHALPTSEMPTYL